MAAPFNFRFQQTMLRIKDPQVTVPFFERHFHMRLLDQYDFPEWKFSLFFLGTPKEEDRAGIPGPPGSDAAHDFLWSDKSGVVLELTHNWGTEDDDAFTVNHGNTEPNRGFGHIAFNVDDVYKFCENLEKEGVKFQKKPDEGRMKGLAFALDPDGYWIEVVKRSENHFSSPQHPNLSQTMIRVKDAKKSLEFYRDFLGMKVVSERHFEGAKFSLYFLASPSSIPEDKRDVDPTSEEGFALMKSLHDPIIELTHNHGTETDESFAGYHNGNDEPRGFGHTGFLVDDLEKACDYLEEKGVPFRKKWNEGNMKTLAFALDPDGYSVEIIKRGMKV